MVMNEAVSRALDIINLVASSNAPLTLTEICKRIGIPKTSAFGLLHTLVAKGALEIADENSKSFKIGLGLFETTLTALSSSDIVKVTRPVIEELNAMIGETILFAVEDAGEMVFLDMLEGASYLRATVRLGTRVQMHCSAIGKAVLAARPERELLSFLTNTPLSQKTPHTITSRAKLLEDLAATRGRKYSYDDEENIEDVRCVGAPIYSRTNKVIAGVSITMQASRADADKISYYGTLIHNAALRISRRMGFGESDLYFDRLDEVKVHQAG